MLQQSVHGHEVMGLVIQSGRPWKREELLDEIKKRWGAEATFHTCSSEGFSADGLLAFLETRGKFVETENGKIQINQQRVCNH